MNQVDLSQLAIERSESGAPMRRKRRHLMTRYVLPMGLLAGFVALLAWAGWDKLFPPQQVTVVPVHVTRAVRQPEGTPLFNAPGWIEPRPTPVRVSALAAGVVKELLVVEDQAVASGEVVAQLVPDDAELARRAAVADLQLREAELATARAAHAAAVTRLEHPVHLEAPLSEAQAKLAAIETQLQNLPFVTRRAEARREFALQDYQGKTAAPGVIARVHLDQAKSELAANTAQVEGLQQQQSTLQREQTALQQRRDALRLQRELLVDEIRDRDQTSARVQAASARVEQSRVALHEAQLRLDRMTIRAPIDGRVFRLVGHPGTTLAGNMKHAGSFDSSTVVTLYRPEWLQIRVDVRFDDLPRVLPGQPVQIRNAALADPIPGKVLLIGSVADIQKNTLEILIAIDQPEAVLKPQMLMDVTFLSPADRNAPSEDDQPAAMRLYIPSQLVQQSDTGPFVWVADQQAGVARRVEVELGAQGQPGQVEVAQGLNRSSRLIASGTRSLRDGSRIQVTGEAPDETSLPPAP